MSSCCRSQSEPFRRGTCTTRPRERVCPCAPHSLESKSVMWSFKVSSSDERRVVLHRERADESLKSVADESLKFAVSRQTPTCLDSVWILTSPSAGRGSAANDGPRTHAPAVTRTDDPVCEMIVAGTPERVTRTMSPFPLAGHAAFPSDASESALTLISTCPSGIRGFGQLIQQGKARNSSPSN